MAQRDEQMVQWRYGIEQQLADDAKCKCGQRGLLDPRGGFDVTVDEKVIGYNEWRCPACRREWATKVPE